jgi:predicted component of type VI protein secretion system
MRITTLFAAAALATVLMVGCSTIPPGADFPKTVSLARLLSSAAD